MSGIELILDERERQIDVEGFGADHDSRHVCGELIQAALYYIQCANYKPTVALGSSGRFVSTMDDSFNWPWNDFKPLGTNDRDVRINYLAKAGALIAAEIDRYLVRMEKHND
jgi:hypothetical protein